jgi:hypothetical protein
MAKVVVAALATHRKTGESVKRPAMINFQEVHIVFPYA